MNMRRILAIAAIVCLFPAGLRAQKFTWEAVPMDGSRTGTAMPTASNVPEALGRVEGNTYYAPDGKIYKGGATAAAAGLMIAAQDSVAFIKEVIGVCPGGMRHHRPESELSNMIVDCVKNTTEKVTGRHVDVALINMGGIREDMPDGEVLLGDIFAMLPFENYLCYLELKGADLRAMLEKIANHVEALSGVTMEIKGRKAVKILVGGGPIKDDSVYGFATIDFLLSGGDGIAAAKNARCLIQTDVLMRDAVLPYLRELTAAGKPISYPADGRVKYVQ